MEDFQPAQLEGVFFGLTIVAIMAPDMVPIIARSDIDDSSRPIPVIVVRIRRIPIGITVAVAVRAIRIPVSVAKPNR
jgi:hypothetical protein